jgi:streptogramin lyase
MLASFARTLFALLLLLATVSAHPASGIVVDDRGNIFFIDSGHALYRIDTHHATTVAC